MKIRVEIVYTHGERIDGYLHITDKHTITMLILEILYRKLDLQKGIHIPGQIRISYTKDDIPRIQKQGISTDNLSHFVILDEENAIIGAKQ